MGSISVGQEFIGLDLLVTVRRGGCGASVISIPPNFVAILREAREVRLASVHSRTIARSVSIKPAIGRSCKNLSRRFLAERPVWYHASVFESNNKQGVVEPVRALTQSGVACRHL